MRSVQSWLDEYSASHRHPVNRVLHFICIPLIVLAILAGLKAIPWGSTVVNAATVLLALLVVYYLVLSWRLAAGMVVAFALLYAAVLALAAATGPSLGWAALGIFAVGWVGQFYGHYLEGARPAFFKDLQFLLIGPLWELAEAYRHLGWPVGGKAT